MIELEKVRQPNSFRAGGDDTKRAAGSADGELCPIRSNTFNDQSHQTLRETFPSRAHASHPPFVDDRQCGNHQIYVVGPHPETLLTRFQTFLNEAWKATVDRPVPLSEASTRPWRSPGRTPIRSRTYDN
jgi:hypothetical protein